jgi:RNA polymerase sigma-70 factor (ECF subfamily)
MKAANDKKSIVTDYIIENQARLYRYALSATGNRDDALDAVQNAVCSALTHAPSLRDAGAVKTWVYRILVNECADIHRKSAKEIPFAPEDMDEGSYTDADPTDGEELYGRVKKLPPKLRTVVTLRFFEEMSLKEIAEATGENVSTVKTQLYTALGKLKVSVSEEEVLSHEQI